MLVDLPRVTAPKNKKCGAMPTLALVTALCNVHPVTTDGIYRDYCAANVLNTSKSPNILKVLRRQSGGIPAGDLRLRRAARE